ncbi:hypothetical protein OJAV_G00117910 [Oryzias javanicus]|uniref:Uncharacterized protein n=1 Tax=Oryzias javanicus TaxID=123683 RepID=A0A437CSG9_ORYJA|nr:hypothetical protein OJAV_G00117910 [Oryzias javanicus]
MDPKFTLEWKAQVEATLSKHEDRFSQVPAHYLEFKEVFNKEPCRPGDVCTPCLFRNVKPCGATSMIP